MSDCSARAISPASIGRSRGSASSFRKKNRPGQCRAGLPCETSRALKAWPLTAGFGSPPHRIPEPSAELRQVPSFRPVVTWPPSPVPRLNLCRKASPVPREASTARQVLARKTTSTVAQIPRHRLLFIEFNMLLALSVVARRPEATREDALAAIQIADFTPNFVGPCCS